MKRFIDWALGRRTEPVFSGNPLPPTVEETEILVAQDAREEREAAVKRVEESRKEIERLRAEAVAKEKKEEEARRLREQQAQEDQRGTGVKITALPQGVAQNAVETLARVKTKEGKNAVYDKLKSMSD